jgi:hypothetical protein
LIILLPTLPLFPKVLPVMVSLLLNLRLMLPFRLLLSKTIQVVIRTEALWPLTEAWSQLLYLRLSIQLLLQLLFRLLLFQAHGMLPLLLSPPEGLVSITYLPA